MLFNSFEYILFLLVVVSVYYQVQLHARQILLLLASYVFYAVWSVPYCLVMAGTTTWYWLSARQLARAATPRERKVWLVLGVSISLLVLFYFKYVAFFVESLLGLGGWISGHAFNKPALDIILPLGISFHTFQGVSYLADVYRGDTSASERLLPFAVYSSFFPQLISGPIERKKDLLPQLDTQHAYQVENIQAGLNLLLWGMLMKVVLADNFGYYSDKAFNSPGDLSSLEMLLGVYAFSFQIFFDFAGYSYMAIGSARLLGVNLSPNFNLPYFSQSIIEFWRRWHMTLSKWLRDYLYIPLGGSRVSRWKTYRNLMITLLLGGLWHGANWTFVAWGGFHGFLLVVNNYLRHKFPPPAGNGPVLVQAAKILVTFHLVCLGWIFFRAQSLSQALLVMRRMARLDFAPGPESLQLGLLLAAVAVVAACFYWLRERFEAWLSRAGLATDLAYKTAAALALILGTGTGLIKFIYFEF